MVFCRSQSIAYTSLLVFLIFFSGCTIIRKYQKNKPFVYSNIINLNIEGVTKDEEVIIRSRLNTQLDDSTKVRTKDVAFVLHYIDRPPAFDTASARKSADNMQVSLINLGYYNPSANYSFSVDSNSKKDQKRVTITYNVISGKRTLIDTFAYLIDKPELQQLALDTKKKSPLQENKPVTKAAISTETNRLVDLYRNNGYYKFTTDLVRVTGDTSIAALTTVSEDPFEALQLLAEANEKRDKPTIKLALQLNKSNKDSSGITKFYINDIYVLPDYVPGTIYNDTALTREDSKGLIINYRQKLFITSLLTNNIYLKKGDVYKQENYYKTLNSLYKLGVWESPAIDIIELKDTNLLNLVVKLIPVKKYGFEGSVELSYSTNSATNNITSGSSGNLLGVSGNLSILNRNLAKQAIRMTNSFRAGVEFNTNSKTTTSLVNSNELSYTNSIVIPKFITPFGYINRQKLLSQQTFINTNLSQINRVSFFNLQVLNTSFGYSWSKKATSNWIYRPLNVDFRRLYNRTEAFDATLNANPFLRYSFNTALVMGQSLSYNYGYANPSHPERQHALKINLEESGLVWGRLKSGGKNSSTGNFFNKYLREFIKADLDYTYTISHPKSAMVFRGFGGVGIPLSKDDTTLPFFKQYYGGGPNSMRGWPVRGIGIGGQKLAPYQSNRFNDRTGDIQLEANVEYRYNIAPLFSNAVNLKGAVFVDAGNIWNFKNTKTDGTEDSAQFKFKNIYKQLGVSAGTGLRFDFNYFLIRFDLGFRIKRPDLSERSGWRIPDVNFKNLFGNKFENRQWRYENFNFTIGIDYPF